VGPKVGLDVMTKRTSLPLSGIEPRSPSPWISQYTDGVTRIYK